MIKKSQNRITVDLADPNEPPGQPAGEFILNSRTHLVVPWVPPGRSTTNYKLL